MVNLLTLFKNALEFSRSIIQFLSLIKFQKQTTSSSIMGLLKAFHTTVIYNCSSFCYLIKPSTLLAIFMTVGIHVYLSIHAWV